MSWMPVTAQGLVFPRRPNCQPHCVVDEALSLSQTWYPSRVLKRGDNVVLVHFYGWFVVTSAGLRSFLLLADASLATLRHTQQGEPLRRGSVAFLLSSIIMCC